MTVRSLADVACAPTADDKGEERLWRSRRVETPPFSKGTRKKMHNNRAAPGGTPGKSGAVNNHELFLLTRTPQSRSQTTPTRR